MEQLLQIALGCFLQGWSERKGDLLQAAELLSLVAGLLCKWSPNPRGMLDVDWSNSWLAMFGAAAQELQNADPQIKSECMKLAKAGQRRYQNFLTEKKEMIPPVLGLCNPENFLEVLREPEARIGMLREVAKQYRDTGAQMIIQYKVNGSFECASASPRKIITTSLKKARPGSVTGLNNVRQECNVRWLAEPKPKISKEEKEGRERYKSILRSGEEVVYIRRKSGFPSWKDSFGMYGTDMPTILFDLDSNTKYDIMTLEKVKLRYITGSIELAMLYMIGGHTNISDSVIPQSLVAEAIKEGLVDERACQKKIERNLYNSDMLISLRALSTMEKILKKMSGLTTPVKVAYTSVCKGKWIPKTGQHLSKGQNDFTLSLERGFACVTLFESGGFNLEPEHLREVLAISSGNSLFIPKILLQDPCENINRPDIKRITGNLGRPGISLLVPPRSPKVLSLGEDCWVHINHDLFNGKSEDCYSNSTLHLSFTGHEMPVDVGDHGLIDTQISFLEAPISLHNRGTWIADLGILRSIRNLRLRQINHCNRHNDAEASFENFSTELTAVDSWEELLENPDNAAIVRAHANWQARLAAMALGIQQGYSVFVLPQKICWKCVHDSLTEFANDRSRSIPDRVNLSSIVASPASTSSEGSENDHMSEEDDMPSNIPKAPGSHAKHRKLSAPTQQREESNEPSLCVLLIA